MSTTNLISKSLGDILTESGNGTPDHTSPKGSIYSDKDTGSVYMNIDNSTAWVRFNGVAYGEVYYVGGTTATTITGATVWTSVGNAFIEGEVLGFSANTDTLVVKTGYDGKYNIVANATIDFVAGADNYEVGVSINGATPQDGSYNSGNVDTTYTTANISLTFIADLVGGDTLELAVQNLDGTNDIIITHGQIFTKLME